MEISTTLSIFFLSFNNIQNIDDSFAFTHYQWALEAQFEELEDDIGMVL